MPVPAASPAGAAGGTSGMPDAGRYVRGSRVMMGGVGTGAATYDPVASRWNSAAGGCDSVASRWYSAAGGWLYDGGPTTPAAPGSVGAELLPRAGGTEWPRGMMRNPS